jgi:hypothetical protein
MACHQKPLFESYWRQCKIFSQGLNAEVQSGEAGKNEEYG